MILSQVALSVIAIVGLVAAAGYGTNSGSYGSGPSSSGSGVPTYSGGSGSGRSGGGSGRSGGGSGSGRSGGGRNEAPKPYSFDYNAADGEGNVHYRNEQGDANGNVKGTYGYTDAQGLYRIVEYVADENGFRPVIKTNEPGVDGKESPADVVLTAEQPPAGLQGAGSASGYSSSGSGSGGYGGGSKPSGKSGY